MVGATEIYLDTFDKDIVNETLAKYGVAVVKSHFPTETADKWKNEIINWLIKISGNKLRKDGKNWTPTNMPYGPRTGMMHSLVSHCPTVWNIREAFYPLYADLLNDKELYTSLDAATVHPYIADDGKDWPHIDQTLDYVDCIQGQVVLTDTTASFRCTPESHSKHEEILDMFYSRNKPGNWLKFSSTMVNQIQEKFDFKYWQIPIHAPKGSVIFWKSNTIHSAKRNDLKDKSWRCVVYVSMRKASDYYDEEKQILASAAREGRTTNHWGTHVFPKRSFSYQKRNDAIEKLTDNPEQLVIPYSPLLRKLTAQEPW